MTQHTILKSYDFLNQLPENILQGIDLSVLCIPDANEKKLLEHLTGSTGKNIVLYKKNHHPLKKHLCRTIRYAKLTAIQLSVLTSAEEQLGNKIIVAYESPISFY